MPHHKSDVEIPWDSFVHALAPVLKRVSRDFRSRYHRRLELGSATRISTANGDAVRLPIEVRGGDREYAIATVFVNAPLRRPYDDPRLEQIAKQAAAEAEKYPTSPPARPGSLVLNYP